MGVINVTPNSFSDGGQFFDRAAAIAQAKRLVDEGADLLDLGGESSRPGAEPVSLEEERRRVLPVLEPIAGLGVPVSVDTCKPELMREAIAAGAAMINDILGLRAPGALEAVAATDCAVCIMHMQGEPRTMQAAPFYHDVVREVADFLAARARAAQAAGVARSRIVIDPGFGFGKTVEHNLALLRELPRLTALGYPVLAGLSRKSLLGRIVGRAVEERMPASVAAALLAVQRGAAIVRVHDVAPTRDALLVWRALEDGSIPS
ncbi:MAG TPA: dihydropteroate synthase [Burkholderiales bacterium]|nr:dihydropteroate synthase [Burkholderiales bacterium]